MMLAKFLVCSFLSKLTYQQLVRIIQIFFVLYVCV